MSKFSFQPVKKPGAAAGQPGGPALDVPAAPAESPASTPAPSEPIKSSAAAAASVQVAATGPVKAHGGAVTEYRGRPSYSDDSENIRQSDITMPRMNIVQKVGDLSNIFTPGDIVLNKETVIHKAPKAGPNGTQVAQSKPLEIVVAGFRPDRWAEKTVGGEQGTIVDTVEQVVAAGGTISYEENEATGKPLYQQLSEALILIKKPDDVTDPSFSYKADGALWAPALWAMKGSAYTNGAKLFRTVRKAGWLKDDVNPATGEVVKKSAYFHGLWELTTFLKAYKSGFFAWIPVPKRAATSETGAETRALAEKVLG